MCTTFTLLYYYDYKGDFFPYVCLTFAVYLTPNQLNELYEIFKWLNLQNNLLRKR